VGIFIETLCTNVQCQEAKGQNHSVM